MHADRPGAEFPEATDRGWRWELRCNARIVIDALNGEVVEAFWLPR